MVMANFGSGLGPGDPLTPPNYVHSHAVLLSRTFFSVCMHLLAMETVAILGHSLYNIFTVHQHEGGFSGADVDFL